jgi:alpha-N-arabinofuranosidase
LVSYNEENGELVLFLVNRNDKIDEIDVNLRGLKIKNVVDSVGLFSDDLKTNNYTDHNAVKPTAIDNVIVKEDCVKISLKPFSFQMVRLGVE